MKKVIAFLSALCVLTAPIYNMTNSIQTYAESGTEIEADEIWGETDDFRYRISGNEIEIPEYKKGEESIVIPSEIEGVPVTQIYESVFRGKNNIISVSLPDTIKKSAILHLHSVHLSVI